MKFIIISVLLAYALSAFIKNKRIAAAYRLVSAAIIIMGLKACIFSSQIDITTEGVFDFMPMNNEEYERQFDNICEEYEYKYICRVAETEIKKHIGECHMEFSRIDAERQKEIGRDEAGANYIVEVRVIAEEINYFKLREVEEQICNLVGVERSSLKIVYGNQKKM